MESTNQTNSTHNKEHTAIAKHTDVKSVTAKLPAMPSFGGVSVVEIAILGAGGYVLWKNRSKIQSLLEKNGIEVPAIVSGDFSELLRTGAKALGGKDGAQNSKKTDRTSATPSSRLDG